MNSARVLNPTAPAGHGRRPPAWIAAIAILLAACGPGATAVPTASPSIVEPSVAPSIAASPGPSMSETPSPSEWSSAPPTASRPASEPPPSSVACATLPFVRASNALSVKVSDVRVGSHSGYDRIVFEFGEGLLPAIRIEVAKPPFVLDPSNLPVTISGSSFVRIKLTGVAVETVPASELDLRPGYPIVRELRSVAGYEGDSTWIAGLSRPVCGQITILTVPSRLVVDLLDTGD
jgi:hypothetical protein